MANELFKRRIEAAIQKALRDAHDAQAVSHNGQRGRFREIVVERLLRPLLPPSYAIGSGSIVDSHGRSSAEMDVIIYSPALLPPMLYSERDGIFPVEATLFAIEVKSRLTSHQVKDSIAKARSLEKLVYVSGLHDERDRPMLHCITKVVPVLFAFSSNLASGGKNELERYRELDTAAEEDPVIPNICVAGRGFWFFDRNHGAWSFQEASSEHDEVILCLAIILNSLPGLLAGRGQPRFGWYVLPNLSRTDLLIRSTNPRA